MRQFTFSSWLAWRDERHSEAELQALKTGDMGPLLDSAAKDSYRERARDLREELEQSQAV